MLFELPSLEHVDAREVGDAVSWLRHYGKKAKIIAGGTDLLGLMKDRLTGQEMPIPEVLINVKTIPEMTRMVYDPEKGLSIGAAVTLNRLATSDAAKGKYSILSQAAQQVGTTPLRYMGTVGGNLCQRPRCLYFRHPHFSCFKKGGSRCYALAGEHKYYHAILEYGKCVMAHPSDMAPALIALKAKVLIAGTEGNRDVPLENFFLGPNHVEETIIKPDELITDIRIPSPSPGTLQVFLKHRIRHSADFALASIALVGRMSGEVCDEIRIVLGGVAPFPYGAVGAEERIRGERLNDGLISKAAETSMEKARPLPMNHYKVDLAKTLVKRALMSIRSLSNGNGSGKVF